MKPRKLLERLANSRNNVRFSDFERLVLALGFRRVDGQGSHRTYEHAKHLEARLNLQPVDGEAKPYQIKQLLTMVDAYNLRIDERDDEV